MNIYTLERRLAKIEKERGVTVDTDNPLHQLLRAVGEPPCATDDEAFLRLLRLMQTSDWDKRLSAARRLLNW
jgi:hypothetical protein